MTDSITPYSSDSSLSTVPAQNVSDLTQINSLIVRWERRLRLTHSAIWLPRAISGALLITLVLALISRVRPLLLPTPLIATGAALIILMAVGAELIVGFWPRSALASARFFDRQFGLRERLSTALEIGGKSASLDTLDRLRTLQIRDTLIRAREVDVRALLPIRWRRSDLAGLIVLLLACGLAIGLPNAQTGVLAQQNALKAVIAQQIQQLQQIKQAIQTNTALSDADKAALSKIADQAIQQLEQPNISQPEAVAALAQAQQAFASQQTPLSSAQQQADQQAGQALSQNGTTQALGSALQKNDLAQAANAAQALSQQTAQLTSQQSANTASALNSAANALNSANPQAAQAMSQAAAALSQQASATNNANNASANPQAAQQIAQQAAAQSAQQASQALQSAAKALNAAQNQASNTSLSQTAQNAAQQTNQGQQQIAQAGNPPNSAQNPANSAQRANNAQTGNPQPNNPKQNNPPAGSSQQTSPQSGNPQAGNPQSGSQPGQPGSQTGNQPGQSAGQQPGSQPGQGSQPGNQPGAGTSGDKVGGAQVNAPSSDAAGDPSQTGASQLPANQQANGSAGAGQGAGGSGDNTTKGNQTQGTSGQTMPTDNGHGDGSLTTTEHVYAPSFVGGQGGTTINPKGAGDPSNVPVQQGGYVDPSSSASASVPLSNVANSASSQADSAMDSEHVPIGLRGVIHDYFSGLQPAK